MLPIRTERLLLRELTFDDIPALNAIERDPSVTRYMSFDPQSPEQTRAYIEKSRADAAATPRLTFDLAIVPHGETTLLGRCGLGIARPEHREASIWYVLSPAAWGRGIATEACLALLDLGFGPLRLHRIWADCDPRNAASCRVAGKLGMTHEGVLRENYFLKGEWCDTAVYAILEHEHKARLAFDRAQARPILGR
jgi:RimJ/RimL family protein N-acetyltransferase